jgi:hypothetical protein
LIFSASDASTMIGTRAGEREPWRGIVEIRDVPLAIEY